MTFILETYKILNIINKSLALNDILVFWNKKHIINEVGVCLNLISRINPVIAHSA